MMEHELGINKFLLGYAKLLTADIADEQFAAQPFPGVNHPAWIVGHLTYTADRMLALMEHDSPERPAEWTALFVPGSKIHGDRGAYPGKMELVSGLEAAYVSARQQIGETSAEVFARPNPHPQMRERLPTTGIAVSFLLTGHVGVHLGQLSAWRRMLGLPPLF